MFFPVSDVNVRGGYKPFFAYIFILINISVFLFQLSLGEQLGNYFVYQYGSIPIEIIHGKDWYTLLTSMFLHGGWMHLLGNMMFLWVFADNIEATIGSWRFLLFYIAGGVVASLTHAYLNPLGEIPCVGASGAIAACLGAYIVMFPASKIRILFILFFTTFQVRAIYFLGFWIVQQFLSGLGSLEVTTADVGGVAYWAHIGGFVFGVVMGFFFRAYVRTESEDYL